MILSIDQGTTGTTVLIVDRNARVVSQAYAELPQHYPKPGWVEHSAQQIMRVTLWVMKKALNVGGISAKSIQAIGITNQRETTIIWEKSSGRPIANAIVWQCRRTAPLCEALKAQGCEREIRRKTGLVVDAYFSGTKIKWLLDNVKGLRARANRAEVAFGTVDSWLLWNLTGKNVHATDYTNASRTLIYNIRAQRWDQSLLDILGIPSSMLPEVKSPSYIFGLTDKVRWLPSGIPIAGMAGDQQASMVGHGCLESGSAKNTYGTGCFLLLNTGSRFIESRHGLITTLVYGKKNKSAYALEGSVFIAGAAIQWLRDALRLIKSAAETEMIARSTKDTLGVYVVPAFVGLGAPYWDMGARGAIVGLTRGSSREVIVRSTLESLAYQTRDVVESMQQDSALRLRELRVDGGAARNDWLMQFQADILGIPLVRPAMIANTAKGAALLAGIGINWWSPRDLERLCARSERRFFPRMGSAERDRRYSGWQEAVLRVRSHASIR